MITTTTTLDRGESTRGMHVLPGTSRPPESIARAPVHAFHRGALALDFVGTRGRRASAKPVERLGSPAELATWLRAADLIPADTLPSEAEYARAIELRETLARLADALADGAEPAPDDRNALNAAARNGSLGTYELAGDLQARAIAENPIDFALGRIALDAIETFARRRDRLTRCELHDCGGLFVTSARGERRRWCSMETCGNRAKVAAHRARRRAEARTQ